MIKEAVFHLKRDHFGQDSKKRETSLGIMFRPDQSKFGYTLEDVLRAEGIKVKKYTAIPQTEGDYTYKMTVRKSPKYGEVVVIYTHMEGDVYVLEYGGIRFEYILIHGGNHVDHTDGCVLCARNRVTDFGKMAIQGSLKEEFTNEVKALESEGYSVRLRVTNIPYKG